MRGPAEELERRRIRTGACLPAPRESRQAPGRNFQLSDTSPLSRRLDAGAEGHPTRGAGVRGGLSPGGKKETRRNVMSNTVLSERVSEAATRTNKKLKSIVPKKVWGSHGDKSQIRHTAMQASLRPRQPGTGARGRVIQGHVRVYTTLGVICLYKHAAHTRHREPR